MFGLFYYFFYIVYHVYCIHCIFMCSLVLMFENHSFYYTSFIFCIHALLTFCICLNSFSIMFNYCIIEIITCILNKLWLVFPNLSLFKYITNTALCSIRPLNPSGVSKLDLGRYISHTISSVGREAEKRQCLSPLAKGGRVGLYFHNIRLM